MRIAGLLLVLVGSALTLSSARPQDSRQSLSLAVDYLWSRQEVDGSWRSDYYGVLKSGQALTPVVLYALLQTDIPSERLQDVRDAAEFIQSQLDDHGALGRYDPDILEYPVYSTAYALQAFRCISREQDLWNEAFLKSIDVSIRQMEQFLIEAQYQPDNGFTESDLAYGSWGFNAPFRHGVAGHLDVAHTRTALQALQNRAHSAIGNDLEGRAEAFLLVLQKNPTAKATQPLPDGFERMTESIFDGGFYFSPTALSANKAPFDEAAGCWPSYATATCDGILALLAAGVPREDPRMQAAVAWLREHTRVDYPEGVPADHPEPWGDAVRFYHYYVRAEVYSRLDFSVADRRLLSRSLCDDQRPDGSFANVVSPLMKEDDPLLCTALATLALANCQL